MSKIEKIIIGMIFVCISIIVINTFVVSKKISDHGGIKQVIIDLGKEVKSIKEEIVKD